VGSKGGRFGNAAVAEGEWMPLKDESTCEIAAEGGHLEVLRWAREYGCPWDTRTCAAAEESGHVALSGANRSLSSRRWR